MYLKYAISALNLVYMWPQKTHGFLATIKQYSIITLITVTSFPILADFIVQFYRRYPEDEIFITSLIENIVALTALYGVIYIYVCFTSKKNDIQQLVEDLVHFEHYSPIELIQQTEKSATFYTKLFISYGIIGNIVYGIMPWLNYQNCLETRLPHTMKYGIPCGLVVRYLAPFKTDYTPLMQMTIIQEIVVCTLGTTIIMMVTMLICGILIHISSHLKHLSSLIDALTPIDNHRILEEKIEFCIKFHIAILDFAARFDRAFNQMMLLHITLTGFIISVLGFEIIMVTNFVEIVRFVMHLAGWLGMLFLVCYYGQILMDESSAIASAVYSMAWYEKPVAVQRCLLLMLLRSQKPLTLRAAGLNIMSLATFLGVLYSAYSYFTLLLKLKPQT